MSDLDKKINEIKNLTATFKFDGDKFEQDLTAHLKQTAEAWVMNHIQDYINVSMEKWLWKIKKKQLKHLKK